VKDEAGTEKADALNNVGGDLAAVRAGFAGEHWRKQSEEGRAKTNEQVGTKASRLVTELALETNDATEQGGDEQPAHCAVNHTHLFEPVKTEWLCELGDGKGHSSA
jgi:hypothetical protein